MSVLLPASPAGRNEDELISLKPSWGLFLALGLVSILVGLLALSCTFTATMASVFVFGVLMVAAGVTELIHAFLVRNLKGFAIHLLSSALYLFVGVFMLEDPVRAAEVLTLLIVAGFLVGGVMRVAASVALRFPAWEWVLLNGGINLVLALMIWRGWPESSSWVIGMFLGIDLVLHGWSWVALALALRNFKPATAV